MQTSSVGGTRKQHIITQALNAHILSLSFLKPTMNSCNGAVVSLSLATFQEHRAEFWQTELQMNDNECPEISL